MNSFITLTYATEHLPKYNSLNKRHFQLFMKKLRQHYYPKKIRYYHCGEYGDENNRPHYHACLFGIDFEDKVFYKTTNTGHRLYTSKILSETWGMGICTTGDVTFESAAYTARYVMKKVTGKRAEEHYEVLDPETGELVQIQPEYTTMSRRPGVGSGWYEKFYNSDVRPRDQVILPSGKKCRPPKFYDRILEEEDPKAYRRLRGSRVLNAKQHTSEQTPERLRVREECQELKAKRLIRKME